MRQATLTVAIVSLAVLALCAVLAGCSGGFAPTLPSPDDDVDVDRGQSTIATDSEGNLLPDGLQPAAFAVTLDGTPTRVLQAIPSREGGISICFVMDTTQSMTQAIRGVLETVADFAAGFTGFQVWWSGLEFGDGTPADGTNTWDFSFPAHTAGVGAQAVAPPREGARTLVQPAQGLTALQEWLAPLWAVGGGDAPENHLKALMEARSVMQWPANAARHFIVLTDVGAHQRTDPPLDLEHFYPRPDNQPFSPYTGPEVLDAFRGWGVVHAVGRDLTSAWGEVEAAAAASAANNDGVRPTATDDFLGWDIRELTDGGPEQFRTHGGTGGKWIEMPYRGYVDLNELGIADLIRQTYTIIYQRPEAMTSAHVVITARYTQDSVPVTATFDLGEVTF